MRNWRNNFIFANCCFLLLLFACRQKLADHLHKRVYITLLNGRYTFIRDKKPYFVKGASGFTNLKQLKEAGGNTIRLWDTVKLAQALDSAQKYGLTVVAGLPMPANDNMDAFYNKDSLVAQHINRLTKIVNRYKNHPALLCWCVGNELAFPYKFKYRKFYSVFNQVVDMIHRDDPDHPVTTTMMTFQRKNIINLKLRTNIDFISFNIFGSIKTLNADIEKFSWFWDGPFLVTEWGIEGPWVADEQNAWGAYVENSSQKKAEQYLQTYREYMPVKNAGFLGFMVFYWGQKQEFTPTWFSLFDEDGHPTEAVNTMTCIWTGKVPNLHAPPIKFMLLNGKGGRDNILLNPGVISTGKVSIDADTTGFTYKWALLKEDWYKSNGIFNQKKVKPVDSTFSVKKTSTITFKAPIKEGPYRLYVSVYDNHGYVATSNVPFYVIAKP